MVVTGAGVSLASGIPTFRGSDPGAVWSSDVTELGTQAFFRSNPAESWRWYLSRFESLVDAEPNDAHVALTELERWCDDHGKRFLLVTQNVDTLHAAAGSRRVVEVHGSYAHVRCSNASCSFGGTKGVLARADVDVSEFLSDPSAANVPRCHACGSLLRQHVLWFDERYDSHASYRIAEVLGASKRSEVVLFCGTSFSVGVTDAVLRNALRKNQKVFNIDPSPSSPHEKVAHIPALAEKALPRLVGELR